MFAQFMNKLIIVFYNVYRDDGVIRTYYKTGKLTVADENFLSLEYTKKEGNVIIALKDIVAVEDYIERDNDGS